MEPWTIQQAGETAQADITIAGAMVFVSGGGAPALLLETDHYLLLETGVHLLLES